MKHSFSLSLCLVFFFAFQTADAQQYRMPRWGLRGGLHGLMVGEHNQGLGSCVMLGPVLDFNMLNDPSLVIAARSGVLLLKGGDGASVGLPLELRIGLLDKRFGLFVGGGFIFQNGEAFFEEKSKVPTLSMDFQFIRPNRSFFWDFGFKYIALPYYTYSSSRWTREASGGGGFGLGFSLGWFLGKWREPKPSDD